MLGGIILNSKLGQIKGLDSNPKLYRLISGGLLDASFYLDLCSPKFPGLFLPIGTFKTLVNRFQCNALNIYVALTYSFQLA